MIFYLVLAFVSSAVVKGTIIILIIDILGIITKKFKLESLVIIMLLVVVICTLLALVPFQI